MDEEQMTLKVSLTEAKRIARGLGTVLHYNPDTKEYRVNLKGGEEATAYYTGDLFDAMGTARLMAKWTSPIACEHCGEDRKNVQDAGRVLKIKHPVCCGGQL